MMGASDLQEHAYKCNFVLLFNGSAKSKFEFSKNTKNHVHACFFIIVSLLL